MDEYKNQSYLMRAGSTINVSVWLSYVYGCKNKSTKAKLLSGFLSNRAYVQQSQRCTACLFKGSYTYKWALMMGVYSHIRFY
jgi:hypothetical protein